MINQMYVVYDSKSETYNKPICMLNNQVAERSARDLMNHQDNEISRNPADFTMFRIGTYDELTAQIKPLDKFEVVLRFHEIQIPFDE